MSTWLERTRDACDADTQAEQDELRENWSTAVCRLGDIYISYYLARFAV